MTELCVDTPQDSSEPLREVALFAGIGGISLACRRAGIPTALVCEIDPACRKTLKHHFPDAVIHDDVTELTADDLYAAGCVPGRTVLTAGFPCQDVSVAGGRRGLGEGTRTGLFWHIDRLLAEFAPAWVVLENVPGLLSAGDGWGDLDEGDLTVRIDYVQEM